MEQTPIQHLMEIRAQLMAGDGWRIVRKDGYAQVVLDVQDWQPFERDQPLTD